MAQGLPWFSKMKEREPKALAVLISLFYLFIYFSKRKKEAKTNNKTDCVCEGYRKNQIILSKKQRKQKIHGIIGDIGN
jgi:hypothetical protein